MSSSPFLPPLQGPCLHTFSSAQSTKMPALQQSGGCGRCRTGQRQYDQKVTPVRQKLGNKVLKGEKKNEEFDHQLMKNLLDADLFVKNPISMAGSPAGDKNQLNDVTQFNALLHAKEAMLASEEAAALAQFNDFTDADTTTSHLHSLDEAAAIEKTTVRSGRLLERRSRRQKVLKRNSASLKYCKTTDINETVAKALNSNDALALFLSTPKTKRLLTIEEKRDLFSKVEELMKVEEVKRKLRLQFGREPTLTEWAEAVGMSCHELQLCLASGECSRDRMVYANLRLIVHVAKQYQGNGLSLRDLLQAGCLGLMKSFEKFKPNAGCRFSTYAYWWIRQSIKQDIFRYSRLIRLPENVFTLLKKIKSARMSCIQQGHYPSNSDLAKLVGISVKRLQLVIRSSRNPVSIQSLVWADQDVTIQHDDSNEDLVPLDGLRTGQDRITRILQEITADPNVETPDLYVAKQFMRQHARNILGVLPSRESQIIRLRYGLHDGEPKSLQDIGNLLGITRERVRQLESEAMDKLKCCFTEQEFEAYVCLLA